MRRAWERADGRTVVCPAGRGRPSRQSGLDEGCALGRIIEAGDSASPPQSPQGTVHAVPMKGHGLGSGENYSGRRRGWALPGCRCRRRLRTFMVIHSDGASVSFHFGRGRGAIYGVRVSTHFLHSSFLHSLIPPILLSPLQAKW